MVTKPVVKHYSDLKRDNEFCLMEPVNNEERCYFMMKSKNYFNSIVNNKLNRVINYIRNTVSDSIKYLSVDDGFIYDPDKLVQTLKAYPQEMIIINYEIETCKNVAEIEDYKQIFTDIISDRIKKKYK